MDQGGAVNRSMQSHEWSLLLGLSVLWGESLFFRLMRKTARYKGDPRDTH